MSSSTVEKIPLWLDCDPGHDDAFAILFAAYHPGLELLGVSTVYGNASLAKTTKNALSVLQAIGRPEICVFPGAAKPFCREAHAAPDIHGDSGLDGTNLLPKPDRKPVGKGNAECNAISEMYCALMHCPKNTAWLVATGALTNIALLFAIYPAVAQHIRGLSIMGGAVGGGFTSVPLGPAFKNTEGYERSRIGNHTPYAEFNIWCDPEAAQSIFHNRVVARKTVLIPLDVTHQAFAGPDIQKLLLYGNKGGNTGATKLRTMFHELLMFFTNTYAKVFGLKEGPPIHDPLAVAVLLANSASAEFCINFLDNAGERWDVDVELAGVEMGKTNIKPSENGVMIPRSLDLKKFWIVLEQCIGMADEAVRRL